MKTVAIFLGGLVSGWLLLWQVQNVANTLEEQCTVQQSQTGYSCKQEIQFVEWVYNVK